MKDGDCKVSEVLQATQDPNWILCWQVFQAGDHSNSTNKAGGDTLGLGEKVWRRTQGEKLGKKSFW